MEADWPAIVAALEAWREGFLAGGDDREDSAVTVLVGERGDADAARRSWRALVSTIISLRTKDDVTKARSRVLLEKAPGPRELLALGEEEIARIIFPAGFYHTKAANLMRIAALILERHGGLVPADLDALLALPGVGRKTANLVLTEGFGLDGICVDTHVHRISNRAGWVDTGAPEKTEMVLREILPRVYWQRINGLLVLYGQQICRPISPYCSRCVIGGHCRRVNVGRTR